LDRKLNALTDVYGFGAINLKLEVHNGKVVSVVFNDEIKVRGLVEKANGTFKPEEHLTK